MPLVESSVEIPCRSPALMHVAAREEVEKFRALLEEHYTVIEWVVAQLSPALGVHSGPGTVGISIIPDAPLG